MKKLFLCGHTGSNNRGCEAIVKSTAELFKAVGYEEKPYLGTFKPEQDKECSLDNQAVLIPYGAYKSKLQRGVCALKRKLGYTLSGQDIIQKKLWQEIGEGNLSLLIGGDTYCYGTPTVFMAHNEKMKRVGNPTVLWCCSVEKQKLTGAVLEDIKKYDLIVVRETESQKNLMDVGVSKDRIVLCCDPAFNLSEKKTELPKNFQEGNTVGINLSPMVMSPQVLEAAEHLCEYILNETNMNICFIPHVYSLSPDTQDMEILRSFFEKYKKSVRVSLVDRGLSCSELKFIIGKTRFFVGARTHSTIAAYSSEVPTLVLGYSIKSRGIAKDLFGREKGYVMPYEDIKNKEDILKVFSDIFKREDEIKAHLKEVLPSYKASVKEATDLIYKRYLKD